MNKIIITGVTGQDGSLMADFLLNNSDSIIIAGVRRLSVKNHENIKHLINNPRFKLINLDIADSQNIDLVIQKEKPDYFINFAANSFVGVSWDMPEQVMQANTMAVLYQLEAIRKHAPNCRYYNAGSSEEFGDVVEVPQKEIHPLRPRSPYGASKCAARHLVKVYRESYGLYAVQGWLFNHEGVRRGEEFVTRKITKNVARIYNEYKNENFKPLELGNMDSMRDWSDAEDFVEGVWMMLNQEKYNSVLKCRLNNHKSMVTAPIPQEQETAWLSKKIQEYVLSSNETHKIREFVEEAFNFAGFAKDQCKWEGKGLEEKYIHEDKVLVKINPEFYRPAEVDILYGDSSRARNELGWKPKTNFLSLVEKMVRNDLKKD